MSADFNPDGPECSNECECWEWAGWAIEEAARWLDLDAEMAGVKHAERLRQAWDIIQIKREMESY